MSNIFNFDGTISGCKQFLGVGYAERPSYSWIQSTGSGMHCPTGSVVVFYTTGTERMRIDENGYIGIGTLNPQKLLDIQSTGSGVLLPRMTQTQKNAITGPINGEVVYDTTLSKYYYYNGTTWSAFGSDSGGSSSLWLTGTSGVYYSTGNVGIKANNPQSFLCVGDNNYYIGVPKNGQTQSVAIGLNAGEGASNTYSVAIGYSALKNDSFGTNVAIGAYASSDQTSGYYTIAIGQEALRYNISGNSNVAIGRSSMIANSDGSYNIGIGESSLRQNISGNNNIGIGMASMFYNTTGAYNIGIGREAIRNINTGVSNIGIGQLSLWNCASGQKNIAIGKLSMINTNGTNNIGIGENVGQSITSGSNNIILGNTFGAGPYSDVSNVLMIGNTSGGLYGTGLGTTSFKLGVGTTNPGSTVDIQAEENGWKNLLNLQMPNINGNMYGPSMSLGKSNSSKNSFSVAFAHVADNSSSNYMTIQSNTIGDCINFLADKTIRLNGYTTNGTVTTINSIGTLSVSSDIRLKNSIQPIMTGAINRVLGLNPVVFKFNSDPFSTRMGFIAQEVQTVIPEAVDGKKYDYELLRDLNGNPILDSDNNPQVDPQMIPRYRGLDSTAILATVVKALQEQQEQIRELRALLELQRS